MKNYICKSDSKKTRFYELFLVVLIAAAFTLTSCENFLNARNVSDEIKDIIAYNNARTVNVSISCKEEMGSVFPTQNFQAKLGYDFEVQFIPNTQNYVIKDPAAIFEAVSWKDETVSRADCVEFKMVEQSLEDKNAGLYRIKVKVIKDVDDIQIRPNCALLPSVVSVSPTPDSTEYNANTTIIITLNTPLENDGGEGIEIPYGENGIKVKYGSIDMDNCFELPVLSRDHKKIIIQPKGDVLAAYMQNLPYVDITFSFSPALKFVQNGTDIYFAQNEKSSFTMKFNKNKEQTDPDLYGLFGSRSELHAAAVPSYNANDFFVIQALADFDTADDIVRNRVSTGFYLSGHAYDLDSGISRIEVVEHRIKDNDAHDTTDSPENAQIYTRENAEFVTDENGNTYFSLYFPLKSKNGAIKITVTAYDGCGNHDSKSFVVFKKVFDENTANTFTIKNGLLIDELYKRNYKTDESTIKKWIKRIHVNPDMNSIKLYEISVNGEKKPVTMSPSVLKYELIMNGTTQSLPYKVYTTNDLEMNYFTDSENNKDFFGYFDLPVEKVSGVSFVFKFSDDMGNSFEKSYSITNVDDIGYYKFKTIYDTYYVYTYYKSNLTNVLQKQNIEYVGLCDSLDNEGNPVKMFVEAPFDPNNNYLCISKLGGFYTDFSDFVINTQPFEKVVTIESVNYVIGEELTEDKLAIVQASVTLKPDTDFDYIYLSYRRSSDSNDNNIYFPANSLTYSFTIDPELINAASQRTLVHTVKDGNASEHFEKYINSERTFFSALDTKAPTASLSRSKYDYVSFIATDNSGQKPTGYIEMSRTGNKYYLENGEKRIPIWEFDLGQNYYTINITDGRNALSTTGIFSIACDSGLVKNPEINWYNSTYHSLTGGGWIFESDEVSEGFVDNRMHGDFYSFDPEATPNEAWSAISTGGSSGDSYISREQKENDVITHIYVKINKPAIPNTLGQFVKMTTYCDFRNYEFWPVPFYFYADSSIRNSGNYDYIQTHSKTVFFVVSDAPTLVQTIVANASDSYEDCKNWTAYEWLSHNEVVDEEQYDFAHVENPTAQKYVISPSVLNKIKQDECYCVIAHFADGSTYVSDVFKKE